MKPLAWILALLFVAIIGAKMICGKSTPPRRELVTRPAKPALSVRAACSEAGVEYPPARVFIRVFKQERELELWGGNASGVFHLLQTFPIAAASGGPGPKRREGDLQVPEGVYHVARFNPHSQFHLSLGVDYPNQSDRILGAQGHLGGDIYIHGNHVSAGCMAMTDTKIEEIYGLARHAKSRVSVHIFPCRMNSAAFAGLAHDHPGLVPFWNQLLPIYRTFETHHVIPKISITSKGAYVVAK